MVKEVYDLLNTQITKEFHSAYIYLDIASYFEEAGLDGYASWYEKQAEEEQEHAMKIYNYLHENNEKVTLGAIDKPNFNFKDNLEPLKAALAHEEYITGCINTIYEAATRNNDYRTAEFLHWFISEQAEEEKNAHSMISNMELFGGDRMALYSLNKDMKARQ
ncbi:MAG: ferritin [Lachnospiraceae bacterium]|nr:ferritin [Lachnospiraceae bacterium]